MMDETYRPLRGERDAHAFLAIGGCADARERKRERERQDRLHIARPPHGPATDTCSAIDQ
jgi:hypothetical protein